MGLFNRFLHGIDGNVAMIFGLVAVPLTGAVGALADYSRAAESRTKVQSVIDGTALALAKRAVNLTPSQMQTEGEAMVRRLLVQRGDLSLGPILVTKGATAVTISANGAVPARFARIWGHSQIGFATTTRVAWGSRKIEVALVLDNTGSMGSSGKMDALKTAATNFVNTLEAVSGAAASVKISIVPFDTSVKVGTQYANATWLTKSYIPGWQQPSWNGCVMDRDQPYDIDDSPPTGALTTLYPARMCANASLAAIMPLTNDFSALRTRISQMQPSGNTNVTIGISWGLATLSPHDPMGGALAYGTPDLTKFMIVLTDGDNTQNRWSTSTGAIDARTALACNTAKAQGINLYTVRVINGNGTLLSNCATRPSMYYNVNNAAQLSPVFEQIANSIQALRLTN